MHIQSVVVRCLSVVVFVLLIQACASSTSTDSKETPPALPAEQTQPPVETEPEPEPQPQPEPPQPAPQGFKKITEVDATSLSAATPSTRIVTFGQIFAPGDVPATQALAATTPQGENLAMQADIKARHADGSIRHAILTVRLPANASLNQKLFLGTAPPQATGTPVTLDTTLAGGFDATVAIVQSGQTYTASARDALLKSPTQSWLQGAMVSEWITGIPLATSNGTKHPHLTARFNIRAFADKPDVRVTVILENNWSYVANPSNQAYDLTVKVGGQIVLQKSQLTHYHHSRWMRTYWYGETTEEHVSFDSSYLIGSGALPSYDTSIRVIEGELIDMDQSWTAESGDLMKIGTVWPYMPDTGARPDIGPLPRWAARYLLSMDERAARVTIGNAIQAGSWSIHYRDEKTGLPITLDDYPYMTLLGSASDTLNPKTGKYEAFPACNDCVSPYAHDSSHQPSLTYLPYLVSGEHHLLEELQFWANWNLLQGNPYYRNFADGWLKWDQVRAQGWSLRTLAQTAYITPDDHPLKAYFTGKLEKNREYYEGAYVTKTIANDYVNELGWVGPVFYGYVISPWMDDFVTWAVGHTIELGFTDWQSVFDWKSRFPIGRMTGSNYCWILGAPYQAPVRSGPTGAFFNQFSSLYSGYLAEQKWTSLAPLPCASSTYAQELSRLTGNNQATGEMTGYAAIPTGYPSNMQPALAVAASLGASGARDAWDVFLQRPVQPDYGSDPQYAVVPRR